MPGITRSLTDGNLMAMLKAGHGAAMWQGHQPNLARNFRLVMLPMKTSLPANLPGLPQSGQHLKWVVTAMLPTTVKAGHWADMLQRDVTKADLTEAVQAPPA